MNYQLIYEKLMQRGRSRPPLGIYVESHHIIPRCMGGKDLPENLVDLTPEEHYLAHQLLVKIYPGHTGLSFAATTMTQNTRHGYRSKNKLYGWLRREHAQNVSKHMTGRVYYTDGKTSVKLAPGEEIPDGFVKGRHYSPTKGTTHSRKSKSFANTETQINNARKRWDKAEEVLCLEFGVSTIDDVRQIVLDIKNSVGYGWLKVLESRYKISRVTARRLIK